MIRRENENSAAVTNPQLIDLTVHSTNLNNMDSLNDNNQEQLAESTFNHNNSITSPAQINTSINNNNSSSSSNPTNDSSYNYSITYNPNNVPRNINEIRLIKVNRQIQDTKFCSNSISTSKYNVFTFFPKFLFEQFRKYSNIFFFMIVLLQQVPDVSPTGRFTTLVPLTFILGVSAIKELIEDFKRRNSDRQLNNKKLKVFRSNGLLEPVWLESRWHSLVVGDIVKIEDGELFPADLLLLSSSEPNSMCYIQTSNLDGETNLKIRKALPKTSHLLDGHKLKDFQAEIECEQPNQHLYEFVGNLRIKAERITEVPISPEQILLRGSLLKNTKWAYGVVIYTGHETKLMKNSNAPPFKRSHVEKATNSQILILFLILLIICLISSIASEVWIDKYSKKHWYLGFREMPPPNFIYTYLTFFILYNNLIPISLQVTLELVKFLQAYFINWDEEMYDKENNFWAVARTSNLNEELGQIQYVFSDKTGTLTCNKMEFKRCSIAGICYGAGNQQEFNSYELLNNLERHETKEMIDEFLTLLATCHTVIPERKDDKIEYQASSPDESALVLALEKIGVIFHARLHDQLKVKFLEEEREYTILNVMEFNSVRKRMSIILKDNNGVIKLYCKGADNVIIPRLSLFPEDYRDYTDTTVDHMEEFAKEGFRTLVLAYRIISEEEYQRWNEVYTAAATSFQNREKNLEDAAELIEKNLILIGATGIEDKLQQGVPETITMLKKAGIKVWVLTGDKIETAVNIGFSCKLLTEKTNLIYLVSERPEKLKEELRVNCRLLENQRLKEDETALILDGKSLHFALSLDCNKEFLKLATSCRTVICCRATPKNKAEIVEFVKKNTGAITLAIGDGANDVTMIQAAHVGVGIYGREGTQALCASDYAIGQFQFLAKLLLVHGTWNYNRLCKVILYSFYKNICLYVIELWFAFSNGFSGQILFERWLIGLYNVLFTAAPPMALGLFDRPCKAKTMLNFPELYKMSQNKGEFNIKVFGRWIFNSFLHSIVLYFVCFGSFRNDMVLEDGTIGDYLYMGNHVYTYCVIIVCLKSGLETESWTRITHISIWGSILFWFFFLTIYSYFWPVFGIAPEMTGMAPNIFKGGVFWLGLLFVPIFVLLPDFIYKSLQRTLFKTDVQAIQESESNNQDVENVIRRSRITETARLLKSAFSFTKVPAQQPAPYRGFAFSQEENGAVTQADLIRVYNTDINKPSGV